MKGERMKKVPRVTSIVWQYLEKLDDTRAYCTLCPKEIKHHGNTANAMQHLRRLHPNILYGTTPAPARRTASSSSSSPTKAAKTEVIVDAIEYDPEGGVPSSSSAVIKTTYIGVSGQPRTPKTKGRKSGRIKAERSTTISSPKYNNYSVPHADSILRMICKDLHPPSIVEDEGFTEFMGQFQCALPTRTDLTTRLLPEKCEEVRRSLSELLISANQIAISFDVWTIEDTRSFLTITAHYIPFGHLRSSVLSTKEVVGLHASDSIAQCVWSELQAWGIEYKVSSIVSVADEALVQSAGMLDLGHLPCIATILDQCAADILLSVSVADLVDKFRNIVAYFKSSEAALALQQRQEEVGEPDLRVIPEGSRRWLSTWKMLERLLLVKDNLLAIYWALPNVPAFPVNAEWEVIKDVVGLLKHLEVLMETELAVERYPTLPKMMPLIRGLRYTIRNYVVSNKKTQLIKDHLVESISTRLGYLETNEVVCKATLLDPRFKNLLFDDQAQAETAEKTLEAELAALFRSDAAASDESESAKVDLIHIEVPSLWSQLDKKVWENKLNNKTTPEQNAHTMLHQYLNKSILARTEDPLEFWRTHKDAYPQLHQLAMKYLCIPAIATPSDWLYTPAGQRMKEKRNLLRAGTAMDHIIFLNSNIDIAIEE